MGLFSSIGKVFKNPVVSSIAGTVGGPLVSGAMGIASTILGNNSSKAEAQKNRDYQTEMSNTSIQRRMADLKAAGLNPLLAVESAGAGASTPSGSQADIKHFDPNSILALSNARLVNAQAQAQENDNNLYEFKKENARFQAELMKKYNITEEKKWRILDAESLEKAAHTFKLYAEAEGQHLSNRQAEYIVWRLRAENEIYMKGFTDEMGLKYPGLMPMMYGENTKTPTQALGFATADLFSSIVREFSNWRKGYKPRNYINERRISR